jgi:hypothetical protein
VGINKWELRCQQRREPQASSIKARQLIKHRTKDPSAIISTDDSDTHRMKLISSLSLTFVLQANSLSSAFHVPTPTKVAVARDKSQIKHRVAPAILGTVAASLLAHPKLVNAIGVGSRVPLTAAAGVSNVAAVKAVSQTVVLLAWSLFLVVTLEWNGFEYFRHLACRIRNFGKEEEMMDVGLAKPSDWKSYTQQLLMRRKNTGVGARIGKFFRRYKRSKGKSGCFALS